MRSGTRVGNWLIWIDVDSVKIDGDEDVVVTVRKAVTGGDLVAREFASPDMVTSLRLIAKNIEKALRKEAEF